MSDVKRKKPIFLYFIKMIFLFLAVLILQQLYADQASTSIFSFKFGSEALFEIMWSGLVLIVLLLFKNKYIFTQKREGFFKSLKYVMPELILSCFFLVISIIALISSDIPVDNNVVFNLALYCLFIGIVEEFLCRGWLLNEFLERYSDTKKEIILSIIFSSFIFGVIHFFNMSDTQGFAETLVQVLNAAAGGVFASLVYYKTKNIWVVVVAHSIWDFSLFLSNVNSLGDCLAGTPSEKMVIFNIVRGIIIFLAYLALCYWVYTKTDLYNGEKKFIHKLFVPVGMAVYLAALIFIDFTDDNYYTCPDYSRKKIKDSYSVSYYNYDSYSVDDYDLSLEVIDDKLVFTDTLKNNSVELCDDFDNYLLIDNKDSYSILIQTDENVVLYGLYPKNKIKHKKEYLNNVKDKLKKHVVTEIGELGTMSFKDKKYMYPIIKSKVNEYLYFDKDNKIYINK